MFTVASIGTHFYGRTEQMPGGCVATKFFYVSFMPLLPLGTHLVLREEGDRFESILQPLDLRSVVLAYTRWWGPLAAAALILWAGLQLWLAPGLSMGFAWAVIALLASTLVGLSYVFFGRLSPEARAQRLIYQRLVGAPVDVARLGDQRRALAAELRATLFDPEASSAERDVARIEESLPEPALVPSEDDLLLLEAALTLLRVEWSLAAPSARPALAEAHRRIWARQSAASLAQLKEHEAEAPPARPWLPAALAVAALVATLGFFALSLMARALGLRLVSSG